ncbi:MAG: hypothetical protein QOJ07_2170 [Thermoleophilaceae bacterium]|jgi:plastocyanin|nr:hypothetical protein [Thermoleophilaceae bacterium]
MSSFHVAGVLLAVWAVLVALLGMRGFPRNRGGERIAIAISFLLVATAIGTAIGNAGNKTGERRGKEIDKPGEGPATKKPGAPAPGAQQQGGGKATALALSADPTGQLKFDKTALSAPAGQVTITMTNPSGVQHNISLRGNGADEHGNDVTKGKSVVQAQLASGSYEFYCSIPGHEQGGMKGTLTVK